MTTGKKVSLGFGLSLLLLVTIGTVSYLNSAKLINTAELVAHTRVALGKIEGLMAKLLDAETGQRGYLLTGQKSYLEPYDNAVHEITADVESLRKVTGDNPRQTAIIDNRLRPAVAEKLEMLKAAIDLHEKGTPDKAVDLVKTDSGKKAMDDIRAAIADMVAEENRLLDERDEMAKLSAQATYWVIIVGTILAALLVIVGGILIVRNISRSLMHFTTMAQHVSVSTSEIAAGSQQQVTMLNQTATSLNQISTTAEEFKTTMQEFSDRARSVEQAAEETVKRTTAGQKLTRECSVQIDRVKANSQSTGESIFNLAEQMRRIGEITVTVHEIAEQTKLLALNASIEAARAGEQGRGFAVVATQIRELANQSKESAGRIEALIGDTRKSMQEVVTRSEEGNRITEETAASVAHATRAFEEIALAIQQTREAMSQINAGSVQQEQGVRELVTSIAEIDSGSKEALAAATQSQRAILSIDQQMKELNDLVKAF